MRYTKNYNLKQPEPDDYVLVEDFNDNSEIIDTTLKKIIDVIGDISAEQKDSIAKIIKDLQNNKADLGEDGKVPKEQLPEIDLTPIEKSIKDLGNKVSKDYYKKSEIDKLVKDLKAEMNSDILTQILAFGD